LWRPCNFTPTHSLTGPVGQLFASRLGGQRFAPRRCTTSQWNWVYPVSDISLQTESCRIAEAEFRRSPITVLQLFFSPYSAVDFAICNIAEVHTKLRMPTLACHHRFFCMYLTCHTDPSLPHLSHGSSLTLPATWILPYLTCHTGSPLLYLHIGPPLLHLSHSPILSYLSMGPSLPHLSHGPSLNLPVMHVLHYLTFRMGPPLPYLSHKSSLTLQLGEHGFLLCGEAARADTTWRCIRHWPGSGIQYIHL
jgi:hypothetical protein